MIEINKKALNLIVDMDEVLVDISPFMYSIIRKNWTKYSKYFKDLGPLTDKQIHERPVFRMDEWLLKDELKNHPDHEKYIEEVRHLFWKDCFDSRTFYSNLQPTKLAKGTLMNKAFMDNPYVKNVYILTRYPDSSSKFRKSKEDFIRKYFSHSKIQTIYVKLSEKKSDAIKENKLEWDLFIDDEKKNIEDIIINTDSNGKEILIPSFGYNKIDPVLDSVIKLKNIKVSFY